MTTPIDTLGFAGSVTGLPEQVEGAHEAAATIDPARFPDAERIDHVVVLGMGGSGISGDVLAAVGRGALPVPVVGVKDTNLPAFVGERSLVFAQSYSGSTEETVATGTEAVARGAAVVAVTSGGALAELAEAHGLVRFDCPVGLQPRAALGALVVPLLVTCFRMGLLPDAHRWLERATEQLRARRDACRVEVEGDANPARRLARRIGRTIPLVYGGDALGAVAAMRWKCDVNENAKAPAFWNTHPELDHNEICGWGQHGDVTRQVLTLVELRHDFEGPGTDARFAASRELIREAITTTLEVRAEGEGPLAQLLDLMYVGDWTSVYLAFGAEVDPGPIDAIAQLKAFLARA